MWPTLFSQPERERESSTNVQCMAGNKQRFVLGVPIRDKMRERERERERERDLQFALHRRDRRCSQS